LVQEFKPQGYRSIGILFPDLYLPEEEREIHHGFVVYFKEAKEIMVENFERQVQPGELIFSGVAQENLPSLFPTETQVIYCVGTVNGPRNFSFEDILTVDGTPVFMMAK